MNKEQNFPKNEIDTLGNIFKQYRVFIIMMTLLSIIISFAYIYFIYKPVYSASALIQIGKKYDKLLEPAMEVETKLLEKYQIYTNHKQNFPKISNIRVIKKTNGMIRLTAEAHTKQELIVFLQKEVNALSSEHNISLNEYIKINREKLQISKKRREEASLEIQKINNMIHINNKKITELDGTEQSLINMYMIKMLKDDRILERSRNRLTVFTRQVTQYKKQLQKTKTFSTHIIDKIIIKDKEVGLTKGLVIVIGGVSGLLLAILISFLLSFLFPKRD